MSNQTTPDVNSGQRLGIFTSQNGVVIYYSDELGRRCERFNVRCHGGPDETSEALRLRLQHFWSAALEIELTIDESLTAFCRVIELRQARLGPNRPLEPPAPPSDGRWPSSRLVREAFRWSSGNPVRSSVRNPEPDPQRRISRAHLSEILSGRAHQFTRPVVRHALQVIRSGLRAAELDNRSGQTHHPNWSEVSDVCGRILSVSEITGGDANYVFEEYDYCLTSNRSSRAVSRAYCLITIAILNALSRSPYVESGKSYEPAVAYADLAEAAGRTRGWFSEDWLRDVYDALHRVYKGTPDEILFPGDGVVNAYLCRPGDHRADSRQVYRRIRIAGLQEGSDVTQLPGGV